MNKDRIIIAVHVDDEALVSNSSEQLKLVKEHLSRNFKKISDLGSLDTYIGIKLTHVESENCLYLSQKDMIESYTSTVLKNGVAKAVIPASPVIDYHVKSTKKLPPIWDKLGVV